MAARGDGVVRVPGDLPPPSPDPGLEREPQVPRLSLRHHHRADQPAPGDRAAAGVQGTAHCREQRAQTSR